AGRRIDIHLPLAVQHVWSMDLPRDRAVRHRSGVVVRRSVPVHDNRAVAGLVREPGQRVVRVDDRDTVYEQPVDIEVGFERTDRQRPDALGVLLEGNGRVALSDGQGIGVFAPNVRGSSGFGKRFVNLDNGALRFDGIKDIKISVAYLVTGRLADPARIGITGGSYGGYMTMAGLTEYPELFGAGGDPARGGDFFPILQHNTHT